MKKEKKQELRENSILRVSEYLFRYKGLFTLTLGLAISSTACILTIPQVVRWSFDELVTTAETSQMVYGILILAACYLCREVFNSLRIRANNTLEQKVLLDLRGDLHRKLLLLPIGFYDRRKSGEIASRVVEDVDAVERALLDGTEQGMVAILTIFGIITILFIENAFLATFICLPLPILLAMGIYHSKATRLNWRNVRQAAGDLNAQLVEDIQGNRLIHSFALREHEEDRFKVKALELKKRALKAMFRWSLYGPGTGFITSMGLVSVVGVGGYLTVSDESFKTGDLMMCFFYGAFLYEPLGRLHQLNHLLAQGRAAGDRVFEILDHPLEVESPADPQPFPLVAPSVCYDNISFNYSARETILTDFKLTLEAGKVTALVGHTGSGKSTLANLLLRYYDVNRGSITVDGIDLRNFDLEELRSGIGHVAQEPFLFDGSVRDNLMLAQVNATQEDMIVALKGASAWDFVKKLPNGLDTPIGEKGIRLSQGEKQRLTISRVLLKNPKLVILDEATASVDTITESLIQRALQNLMESRTVLIIAHRLSTVRDADNIIVLEHGCVAEQGTHRELVTKGGVYANLWQHQADIIPES